MLNAHVLRGLNYHTSEDKKTHSMCCRINCSSKMHDSSKKSSEEKVNNILRLATRPVYLQIEVDSMNKFVRVTQSFCPCVRGYKCRHKVAALWVLRSLQDSCTSTSMKWHTNAYLPTDAQLELELSNCCSLKQTVAELEFTADEIDKVKKKVQCRQAMKGGMVPVHNPIQYASNCGPEACITR